MKKVNLIITGVEEKYDVEKGSCLGTVNMVLRTKLELNPDDVSIINCHRLGQLHAAGKQNKGQATGGNRPRPILIHFNTMADRNKVWQVKKKLKGSKYFIAEDYAKAVEKKTATLLPYLRMARASGDYTEGAYMVADKLVLSGKRYTVDTIDQLPKTLDPKKHATQCINNVTYFFTKDSPFSNHNLNAPFKMGSTDYKCTEQRFFAAKAKLLGDQKAYDKIMAAQDGAKALEEGKKIIAYTKESWEAVEEEEMRRANVEKFRQNPVAKAALMATGKSKLAEASKNGKWGIGFALHDPEKEQQMRWKKNLLGNILTQIRSDFQA